MVKSLALATILTIAAGPIVAQSAYDGRWAGPLSSCTDKISDRRPMEIADGFIWFYESRCALTNPVNIRDMQGQIFDVMCSGEGETWVTRSLLLLNNDGTLTFASNGNTNIYQRCE